jgi:hypothetical protein
VAYDFVLYLESIINKIRAKGSMAIIVLEIDNQTQKATNLYYFRNNGNPLVKQNKEKFFKLASENKKGTSIEKNTLYTRDLETGITIEQFIDLPEYKTYNCTYTNTSKMGFNYDDSDNYYNKIDYKFSDEGYSDLEEFYSELTDDELQERIIDLESDIKHYDMQGLFGNDDEYEYDYSKLELNIAKSEYEMRKTDIKTY